MVVRMRSTRSHTGNRRSHHRLEKPALTKTADGVQLRHRANPKTGMYRGRKAV